MIFDTYIFLCTHSKSEILRTSSRNILILKTFAKKIFLMQGSFEMIFKFMKNQNYEWVKYAEQLLRP